MKVAAAVGGQHRHGGALRGECTEFGNRHRCLTEELQQQCLELVVGTVDLVDEQHRLGWSDVAHAGQDRPVHQVGLGVQIGLGQTVSASFRQPDAQQLALIVPVVQRLGSGEALIALQPDQRCIQHCGKGFRGHGLADAGLALEQQGPIQLGGKIERRRRADVEQIPVLIEASDDVIDVDECHCDTSESRR